jgi:ribose transport system ATP-binding protein
MSDAIIRTVGLTKAFSGVQVLKDISVEIREGEILGLIGENGAGKSTFVKLINGTYAPTSGEIAFSGITQRKGIATIPQEISLVGDLNVYENILLGHEIKANRFFLDRAAMRERAGRLLRELHTSIDPDERIDRLSVAQKRMVEIAKALSHDARVLIMDEPTASLTQNEINVLLHLMRQMKKRGVTIIFVSHRLKEIKQVCDRVMVLRDGDLISIGPASELTEAEMARRMVGRELDMVFPPKATPKRQQVLKVQGLSVEGVLSDISFELWKGEVLGFSGLMGSGRTELAEAIIGIRRRTAGRVFVGEREVDIRRPSDAVRCGIAYLSEDRQGIGVLTSFGLAENTTLVSLKDYCRLLIDFRKERERAGFYMNRFSIKAPSIDARLEFLSGGNQQKVSLAKCLDPGPEIFILDEPTRGIDVYAKREIYDFIHELVASGISCILISSELEEIIGMSNRVAVMRDGRISGVVEGGHINEEEIMYYATGVKGRAS